MQVYHLCNQDVQLNIFLSAQYIQPKYKWSQVPKREWWGFVQSFRDFICFLCAPFLK